MIQDEDTEWPTFESILREIRADREAEEAAREAAAADLLVADEVVEQVELDNIAVDDLAVEHVSPEAPVVEEFAVDNVSTGAIETYDFVPQDEPVIETTPSEFIAGAAETPVAEVPGEDVGIDEPVVVDGIDQVGFVPQDEPVIETTPSEFIAEASDTEAAAVPATDTGIEIAETDDPPVEEVVPEEPLNPFDPDFEGIAEVVVEDDEGWISHSDSGIQAVNPEALPPLPEFDQPTEPTEVTNVDPPTELTEIADVDPSLDLESYSDSEEANDSYDELELWDLDKEIEQEAVVIPLRPPIEPEIATNFVGLEEQPAEADTTATANTFALRPNVFSTGQADPNDPQPTTTDATLFSDNPDPAPPIGAIPVADPSPGITPGVKPEDPWSSMRPKEQPEKITFWANRPKFFGGDERRKARARREAAAAQEAMIDQMAAERSCPNCGATCRVDVHDKALNRLHISCNSCRHMWVEDVV